MRYAIVSLLGLALTAPLTFGEFQQTMPPREMQFALRYEF